MVSSVLMLSTTPARAQIIPDRTLGAEGSRLTPNVQIKGASADRIDGGAQRGSNLFHSFSQFNVGTGQRVYFVNPTGVQNILTRVTGKSASNILGTLGVFGSANLFLLNPNGILFGQNARLDLGGSFVGTTANAIRFGEQGIFSATTPEAPPLLNVKPSALFFNQLHPEAITNQSQAQAGISPAGEDVTGLRVPDGQSLLLVGGNINVDGGGLRAYGGNIELAGLAAPGNVSLNVAGTNLSLALPDGVERADVSLGNQAEVNVRGADGGSIKIHARNVNMAQDSKLRAGIDTGLGTPNSLGGNIEINATGATTLSNSTISNVVLQGAFGKAGDINIKSGSFTLRDDAQLIASTFGQGNAGSVFIQASDAASLTSASILSNVARGGVGNGGDINIQARSLTLSDGAELVTAVRQADGTHAAGRGNAGNVNVDVPGALTITGVNVNNELPSAIYSDVETGATGNGGNINIKSGSLTISDSAGLNASTFGQGNAGSVFIQASDAVSLTGQDTAIISNVNSGGVGNGGNISIKSGSFTLRDGASLSASTFGQGDAGSVFIQASDAASLADSAIFSNVESGGVGKGGNINIQAGSLTLSDGAELQTAVNEAYETLPGGRGNAGNVNLDVRGAVSITGSKDGIATEIVSDVKTGATGNGGDINIKSGSFGMSDDARLNTTTLGQGNAGSVFIQASDAVSLANAYIFSAVAPGAIGNGGAINIQARNLSLTKGSSFFASTGGQGNGGNISLQVADSVSLSSKSTIYSAMAPGAVGNGGKIDLQAGSLSLTDDSSITVSNFIGKGTAGNVSINTVNHVSINGGALVGAETGGQGNAGKVTIRAGGAVSIAGRSESRPSGVDSTVEESGVGNGGDIEIQARSFSLSDGANLSSVSYGKGNAGNIAINTADSITVRDSGVRTFTSGQGDAGKIAIRAGDTVSISGTSNLSSAVGSQAVGNGGDMEIQGRSFSLSDGASLYSTTFGKGNAGNAQINTISDITFKNGSQVNATTSGQGNAGNVIVNPGGTVSLDGAVDNGPRSGIFTTVNEEPGFVGRGKGGNINVNARTLSITNDAALSSSSSGQGSAGDITANFGSVRLDNRGVIAAATNSGDGGNINLTAADNLLLRHNSSIFTTAGLIRAGGNGGNITIHTPFIIALPQENSHISANAYTGKGGNVSISAQGIFGISARSQPTLESDITASSQLGVQGQISITQPEVQPTQGLVELPGQVLDASNQIAQTCPRSPNARRLGEFIVTGRGSLPPNPLEPLAGTPNLSPLATLDESRASALPNPSPTPETTPSASPPAIVEAQGWIKDSNGTIVLVAFAPQVTPYTRPAAKGCPVLRQ